MKKGFSIVVLLFLSNCIIAQIGQVRPYVSDSSVVTSSQINTQGSVVVKLADPRINSLVEMHKREKSYHKKVQGYRIQIIQDSNRDLVREQKTKLLRSYPTLELYEIYESPFFKLRAGNYKSRIDAYKTYHEIKRNFKRTFIVPDMVDPASF
jgi:hypothetical protein